MALVDDPLAGWRAEFPILETCTYLVSHSLGAMPRRAERSIEAFVASWRDRGMRAWSEGWWDIGVRTGDLLAPILGVLPNTISMHQNVTVAQAIIASCHRFEGHRRKVVLAELDFPSNHYLFEGFRRYGAEIAYVGPDDPIRLSTERVLDAIDDRTVLVALSLVLFKSAFVMQDVPAIVEKTRKVGARLVLDIYQAAGTVPLSLGEWDVDFAVGGSVKWLCGGPGAGYLYVRPELAPKLEPAFAGWAAHRDPFAFETGPIRYAAAPQRFQTGTPNVPALFAARAGCEIVAEIGVRAIREKSLRLTRRLIEHAREAGYRVNTSLDDHERGGTVVIDMPDSGRIAEELVRRQVLVDHRPGAGIRMAPHFYNTEDDVDNAMEILADIIRGVRAVRV